MDRASKQPLSIAEAKLRLHSSVAAASPYAYVRQHPYALLGIALTAGFLFGKNRVSPGLFTASVLKTFWAINKFI